MPDEYLHGHHDSVLRSHRWRTAENSAAYLLPRLKPSDRLLDVGCGPGTITAGLATHVREVVGLDAVEGVLAEASKQAPANVTYEQGDVYHLAYGDKSFDVVHAHQVLQHLSDPVAALREMRRVGRLVAVRDVDFGGMFWSPADPELDEWLALYHQVGRAVGGEPDAGRYLLGWAREARFEQVELTSSVWAYSTDEERAWWGGLWAERLTKSNFAQQATSAGLASSETLERLSNAWRRWASSANACFFAPHGEIIAW